MKIEKIAFIVILVFSIIGAFVSSTAIHEISHYKDYSEIAKDSEICALALPQNLSWESIKSADAGYYKFSISPTDEEKYNSISRLTEIKAYSIDIALIFLVIVCIIIVIIKDRR